MPAARRLFPLPVPPDPSTRLPSAPRRSSLRLRAGGRQPGDRGGERAGPGVGSAPADDPAPPGAFPAWQWAATGSGTAGKARGEGGSGVGAPAISRRRVHPPSVTALRQQRSPNPRPREPALVAALSTLPALLPGEGRSREGARWCLLGVAGRPSHGETALPPRPASHGGVGWGGADGPQCAPGGSRLGERRPSAWGPRRCRPPTRPVLKHGPRSLTHARVRGSTKAAAAQRR